MTKPLMPLVRVVFFGTGDIGVPTLASLRPGSTAPGGDRMPPPVELIGVITGPDRPSGRGLHLRPGPIVEMARAAHLPCLQPSTLKEAGFLRTLADWHADIFIVMAYGKILPRAVLDMPPLGSWNLHASLLPRHRGASPIQSAILAGDAETGVSLMRMEEGLDTGPVLWQEAVAIGAEETAGELHDRLAHVAALTLKNGWSRLIEPGFQPEKQKDDEATYAPKIHKRAGEIDWTAAADVIARRQRAFAPWPGSFTHWPTESGEPKEWKIWRACADMDPAAMEVATSARPGTILRVNAQDIEVATGRGLLRIFEAQLPGKKRLPMADFLRGHPLHPGMFFCPTASRALTQGD
jgi:methionyl-tRNA formyltransferase